MTDDREIASRVLIQHYHIRRPIDWDRVFEDQGPLQIEIGFGLGEFLLRNVIDQPDNRYVGIELDWGRMKKCLRQVSRMPQDRRQMVLRRLRMLHVDAWVAFERLVVPCSTARIECLFPCPWPKDRHEHHRLFSRDFLRLINSRLRDEGELRVVTDDSAYADWIAAQAPGSDMDWQQRAIPAVFGTKFEKKWTAGGQRLFHELIFHKQRQAAVPMKEDFAMQAFYHDDFIPERFSFEQEIDQGIAVAAKDWLYDPRQEKGVVRMVVSEDHLTQHFWVMIVKTRKGWCVLRSEGQQVLPTAGTARAIELVSRAVERTTAHRDE